MFDTTVFLFADSRLRQHDRRAIVKKVDLSPVQAQAIYYLASFPGDTDLPLLGSPRADPAAYRPDGGLDLWL